MNAPTQRRLGFLFLGLGTVLGLLLLLTDAPLWAFYIAPLATLPLLLYALHIGQHRRRPPARRPRPTVREREPVVSGRPH